MADNPQLASVITGVVLQRYQDRVISQTNRRARTACLLNWEAFDSQGLQWDVETTGQLAETYAEDDAITNRGSDTLVQALIANGAYRSAFGITAQAAAKAARAGNPTDLVNLFRKNITNSAATLASKLNVDLFSGTAVPAVIGMATAILDSGTYSGVDPATHVLWKSTRLHNSAVVRALTLSLLRELNRTIVTACGEQPDLYVTTPFLADKYGEIADPERRFVDHVRTAAGEFSSLDLGYKPLEFEGIPIIADKDCTAGVWYALNSNYIMGRFLPSVGFPNDGGVPGVQLTMGDFARTRGSMVPGAPASGGLTADVIVEGRSADRLNMFLRMWPQLQVLRRNSLGKITDLPTS